MTSPPFSESSQALDGLGVTYEELLFYKQRHMIGKRVCPSNVLSILKMLNLHEASAWSSYDASLW